MKKSQHQSSQQTTIVQPHSRAIQKLGWGSTKDIRIESILFFKSKGKDFKFRYNQVNEKDRICLSTIDHESTSEPNTIRDYNKMKGETLKATWYMPEKDKDLPTLQFAALIETIDDFSNYGLSFSRQWLSLPPPCDNWWRHSAISSTLVYAKAWNFFKNVLSRV